VCIFRVSDLVHLHSRVAGSFLFDDPQRVGEGTVRGLLYIAIEVDVTHQLAARILGRAEESRAIERQRLS
jgi:hypothetical protein